MRKLFLLLILIAVAIPLAVSAFDDEQRTLSAAAYNQTCTFTKPAKLLTIINDGTESVYINFNGVASSDTTATSGQTASIDIKSSESWSWAFDIANVSFGIREFGYTTSTGTATMRVFAITD